MGLFIDESIIDLYDGQLQKNEWGIDINLGQQNSKIYTLIDVENQIAKDQSKLNDYELEQLF